MTTSRGSERVVAVDIWRESVTLKDEAGERRVVALADLKQEVGSSPGRRDKRKGDSP